MASQKILTIRMVDQSGGTGISIEYGAENVEKHIPSGEGLMRMSVIFDVDGKLSDAEIVTTLTT